MQVSGGDRPVSRFEGLLEVFAGYFGDGVEVLGFASLLDEGLLTCFDCERLN